MKKLLFIITICLISACGHESSSAITPPLPQLQIVTDGNLFNHGQIKTYSDCGFTIQMGGQHAIVTDPSGDTYEIDCDTLLVGENNCQVNVFNSLPSDPNGCN